MRSRSPPVLTDPVGALPHYPDGQASSEAASRSRRSRRSGGCGRSVRREQARAGAQAVRCWLSRRTTTYPTGTGTGPGSPATEARYMRGDQILMVGDTNIKHITAEQATALN